MLKLVDISLYNKITDHVLLKNSVDGVLIKSSQGTSEDPKFREAYAGQVAVGQRVGIWHFYHPDMAVNPQITTFINIYNSLTVKPKWIGLDCEESVWRELLQDGSYLTHVIMPPNNVVYSSWLRQWLDVVADYTGIIPTIYTRATWWDQWVLHDPEYWSHYPLWVAHYNTSKPTLPVDWKVWKLWQVGTSVIQGIFSPVDTDYFDGTEAELDKYFGIDTPPEPPIPPEPEQSELFEDLMKFIPTIDELADEIEDES